MTNYFSKAKLSDFTKQEFLSFVTRICNAEEDSEEEGSIDVQHFNKLVPHPEKSDLIFWPPDGIDRTAVEIVNEIEKHCIENNLPCFK